MVILSLLILTNLAEAQWYFKKYQVKDINQLTKEQLDESLSDTRVFKSLGGISVVVGFGFLLANKYGLWESDTNPTPTEKLIGRKSMHDIYAVCGVTMISLGTIAFFGYLERSKNIKIVIHRNFPTLGSLNLSPRIIYNNCNASGNYGLALTCNF